MVRGEKALEEVLNVGAKDLESNALEKDNRELEAFSKGALLKSLATMNLAYVAPYLSLARVAGKEAGAGAVVTIRVRDVNILATGSYTVVRMCTLTDIDASSSKKSIENVLYTFRNLSSQVFEPFVYIGRTGDGQEVFAYSNDNEFLVARMGGDDETVLQEVKKMATEKEMRSLARFVDLIEQEIKAAAI
ncbi:hypothetical protein Desku_3167 [Desulfofundulus kuznetsovii DSM 6115]|uniref:Uncharacterized protein n=1 Tax=Desulfofundulus kuznetsovii (strain DSM 6115 / VKM B-1805 / 17) TaxID=760568 RepID=A0AAU8PZ91_DESK7|nr:hypothetical protein Desku_3167 [Desulfofundulus kuznetsovii DSM 6115]